MFFYSEVVNKELDHSILGNEARRLNRAHIEYVFNQPVDLEEVEAFVSNSQKTW